MIPSLKMGTDLNGDANNSFQTDARATGTQERLTRPSDRPLKRRLIDTHLLEEKHWMQECPVPTRRGGPLKATYVIKGYIPHPLQARPTGIRTTLTERAPSVWADVADR